MTGAWVGLALVVLLLLLVQLHGGARCRPGIMGDTTPSAYFPVVADRALRKELKAMTRRGWAVAARSRVVFAGLARDIMASLPHVKWQLSRTSQMFRDWRLLVVENDSTDGTRAALLAWAQQDPRVVVLGCGVNAPVCHANVPRTVGHPISHTRIHKMTVLRNIYMDHISREYADWDYAGLIDLDITGRLYMDGIANSLGHMDQTPSLHVMCANGLTRVGGFPFWWHFYDGYAVSEDGTTDSMVKLNGLKQAIDGWERRRGDPPERVASCFSGFTLYRITPRFLAARYDATLPDSDVVECEHVRFHRNFAGHVALNPSMINTVLDNPA